MSFNIPQPAKSIDEITMKSNKIKPAGLLIPASLRLLMEITSYKHEKAVNKKQQCRMQGLCNGNSLGSNIMVFHSKSGTYYKRNLSYYRKCCLPSSFGRLAPRTSFPLLHYVRIYIPSR